VLLRVGDTMRVDEARRSWVATHEIVHASLPSFGYPHQWLEEGLATYIEPLARARARLTSPDEVWRDFIVHGPDGTPKAGDQGLERTHTWGRTYWGGALFCLLADLEIRVRTGGAHSLDDALRAFVRARGGAEAEAEIDELIAIGDRAVGAPVLRETYDRHALRATPVDLGALWRRLGVSLQRDRVVYDERAPLAPVRRAMTSPASQ
jgi:hypothetical protein